MSASISRYVQCMCGMQTWALQVLNAWFFACIDIKGQIYYAGQISVRAHGKWGMSTWGADGKILRVIY